MSLTLDERVKLARDKILPILAEYKLDLGTKHFWKAKVENAKNILDFIDSEVYWLDKETPVTPTTDAPATEKL